ncbi:formin-like protein 5 [Camelus ferus]|uniref:Formin-like protein 5 n=1 Tax=Camelus ferus TaxID=419612 RepID=A0A8B8UAT0_CAMFR|nr:formin-like protein 5 [Camelus ferus]
MKSPGLAAQRGGEAQILGRAPTEASNSSPRPSKSAKSDPGPRPSASDPRRPPPPLPVVPLGVTAARSPWQEPPGHAPTPPGPGTVFLRLSGPSLAGARRPPSGRLLAEPAVPPPTGRCLALACAQPAAAARDHRADGLALRTRAQLLRRAPAPHLTERNSEPAG